MAIESWSSGRGTFVDSRAAGPETAQAGQVRSERSRRTGPTWPTVVASDWDNDGWRRQALCQDTDPDLFFPAGSTGVLLEHVQAAKAVCARCPVRARCLQYALETNQDSGIWGGTTEEERRPLRRAWLARRRGQSS